MTTRPGMGPPAEPLTAGAPLPELAVVLEE
jgi:hypothetical protein